MKRFLFLLCLSGTFINFSCSPHDPDNDRRLEFADALGREVADQANSLNPTLTDAEKSYLSDLAAVVSSNRARQLLEEKLEIQDPTNHVHFDHSIPKNLELEFNPYEVDGEIHNTALDLIARQKVAGIDLIDKLKNRDKATIDMFLKLDDKFKDDNVRALAVDAISTQEVSVELEEKLNKIICAKDYIEGISYLEIPEDEKTLVQEVFSTCNDYHINEANFETIANYINSKITFLLTKGKDITESDQRLACMFTILKHSYYFWHVAK